MSKVTSKDLYSMLREQLASGLKVRGFKRTAGGMLGWSQPFETEHITFWFQCDKYGWMQDFGSSFTLEFQLSDDPKPGTGSFMRRKRFAQLVPPADLEFVQTLNNSILSSLPPLSPSNPVNLITPNMKEAFLKSYQPHVAPYDHNKDVWLHYLLYAVPCPSMGRAP